MRKVKKPKRKTKLSSESAIGVSWYKPEQWDQLLEISSDNQELEDNYEEWKVLTKENLRKLSQHGYVIRKVDIDVEELLSWCKLNHRTEDANSRSEFTVVKLRELDKKFHNLPSGPLSLPRFRKIRALCKMTTEHP